ncbi:uncharacterized protein LOC105250160 isoform X2 [Camponotus floridanus]|uniref:uncharacterized protein LOC105250160 isoform X2 n=1 Tax=Camponotus floridanus TaxID=104421 RepID=UPI000DC6A805|nr:uncharacterized protein LOC105250160 isoform X2 [Camponotus floridanus]
MHSDDGLWSCLMRIANGGEHVATVSVAVTETYLMAEQTEIAVSARNDPVLSCHILPRMLDRTVHYCRWIRPDGYGIYNDISHRYTTNSSYSECRLVILSSKKERRMPTNRLIVSYTRRRTFDPRREFIPINIVDWADYTSGDE